MFESVREFSYLWSVKTVELRLYHSYDYESFFIKVMFTLECTTFAPIINANIKRNPNPNPSPKPNLNPYPTQNQKPNHYPHSNSLLS